MQRFAEHQLDQFENLRLDTGYGLCSSRLPAKLPSGSPAEAFIPVPAPAPSQTGRFACVGNRATAHSREDLLQVIAQMRDDPQSGARSSRSRSINSPSWK